MKRLIKGKLKLIVTTISCFTTMLYIPLAHANNNSNSSHASGFGGIITLFSVGALAFLAPRLRKESLEDNK